MRGFNYKKAVQALNFFSQKEGGKINKMKAIKLIWLADRFHLRNDGRTITDDTYFALKNGPIPSTTRDILELNSFSLDEDELHYSQEYISIIDQYNYKFNAAFDSKVFSETEIDALTKVYSFYGKYDHWALSEISHQFPEWKKFESALQRKVSSRFNMNFEDFFGEAEAGFDLINISPEIKEVSKEIFEENNKISQFFKN